jgi:hypothetical protein
VNLAQEKKNSQRRNAAPLRGSRSVRRRFLLLQQFLE